jgi:hypothetical protein
MDSEPINGDELALERAEIEVIRTHRRTVDDA